MIDEETRRVAIREKKEPSKISINSTELRLSVEREITSRSDLDRVEIGYDIRYMFKYRVEVQRHTVEYCIGTGTAFLRRFENGIASSNTQWRASALTKEGLCV